MALREDSAIPAPTGTDLPHNLSQPGQRLPARGSPCPAHRRIAAAGGPTGLPVLTVDEPIYRRLPAFLIATVDKFAAMPWVGSVGSFFGRVERADNEGFYGPADPGQGTPLPAPLPGHRASRRGLALTERARCQTGGGGGQAARRNASFLCSCRSSML